MAHFEEDGASIPLIISLQLSSSPCNVINAFLVLPTFCGSTPLGPDHFTKLNWDASVDVRRQMMGMGVVARNSKGEVMAMLCATKKCIPEPTAAEALAAWQAVQLL